MMIKTSVRRDGQVTLPVSIRKEFHVHEGDIMEVEATNKGILLKPKQLVDSSQAYFWTKEWQEEIKKSEDEIKKGDYKAYRSSRELKRDIEK
jgi:AbrB family looped-hinge helix DNA binding protein